MTTTGQHHLILHDSSGALLADVRPGVVLPETLQAGNGAGAFYSPSARRGSSFALSRCVDYQAGRVIPQNPFLRHEQETMTTCPAGLVLSPQ